MKTEYRKTLKNRCFLTNRRGYRRLLSIGVSALLSISTFLAVIPQTETIVYADDTPAIVFANGSASNIKGKQESSVYFGNYFQSNDTSEEPIKWRVLQNNTTSKTLFLLSDKNLDCKKYNETVTDVTWSTCTLRKWLNGEGGYENDNFIKSAFTTKEHGALRITTNANPTYPEYTGGGTDTSDRVFLLSVPEAKNKDLGFTDDNSRKSAITAYSKEQGVFVNNGNGYWWLRSPGDSALHAAIVMTTGFVKTDQNSVNRTTVGVRPALNIDLSSVILTSAAVGGKSSGTTGAGALTKVGADTSKAWKFTLKDDGTAGSVGDGHKGFTAEAAGETTVEAGKNIKIKYSGAKTGNNEYVSAMLCDSAGKNILYYGRIANDTAADDDAEITIPAEVEAGSYKLMVFAEQYNDDYKTDLASSIVDFDITVEDPLTPVITTTSLSDGKVDNEYSQTLTVENATGDKKWSITAGSLPDGLDLSGDGKIAGTPTKAGTFDFTVKVEAGNGEATKDLSIKTYDKDTETCKITFKANGGRGEMNPQTEEKGKTIKLRANDFTRSGYEFKNWNTKADGSGDKYNDKQSVKLEKDLTLYAQWKEKHEDKDDDDDDDDHEDSSESSSSDQNNTKIPDGFDELRAQLSNAIASALKSSSGVPGGKPVTVYCNKGTSLPADIMKTLHDNPNVTLVFTCTYQGVPMTFTIPGSSVVLDPAVQWYGPLKLYGLYGNAKTAISTQSTAAATGTYTVKSGDSLKRIATMLNTTVKHLQDVNNIKDPDKIKTGMVLKY